jgi:hypothetical protein
MASMAKLPKAADDVDQAGLAPYGEGRVERLGVDELVAQDLRGERVEQLLVCVREVRHLLAYAIMAGLLVGVYAGLVLLTIQVFRVRTPGGGGRLHAGGRGCVQSAAAVAGGGPAFNRARYDADQTVAVFAARLEDAVDLDAVRDDLASVVHQAWSPPTYRCGSTSATEVQLPYMTGARVPGRCGSLSDGGVPGKGPTRPVAPYGAVNYSAEVRL